MKNYHSAIRILVIDAQSYWRQLCAHALREAGFFVKDCADYQTAQLLKEEADFIILSCTKINSSEQELISQFLQEKRHLLVFSSHLPSSTVRSLYSQGIDDVADKTYAPPILVELVQQLLAKITPFGENTHLVKGRISLW